MAGLPGVGISGLFYVLLAGWMALREGWALFGAAARRQQAWTAVRGLTLAAGMVGALWLEGWGIREFVRSWPAAQASFRGFPNPAIDAVMPAFGWLPPLILLTLVAGLRLAQAFAASGRSGQLGRKRN